MTTAHAIDRLIDAKTGLDNATTEYRAAILAAVDAGLPNTQIAAHLGVTEAAIRMWRKRNPR